MKTSETITKLASALAKFQSQVPVVPKSEQAYGYKYAALDTIIEHIRQPLAKNGLSFLHLVGEGGSVSCMVLHESGEYIQSDYITLPVDNSNPRTSPIQKMGSAITYAKRYTLSAMLGLSVDEDTDAAPAKAAPKPQQTKAPVKQDTLPELKPGMDKWDKAVESLKAGTTTLAAITKHYRISIENQNKLSYHETSK
jgi:hypothetical protein